MEDGLAADRSNVWRHGPIICDCDMDHFSILEIIGASAIALLGMAVSKPTVIAVLEWLGYRFYNIESTPWTSSTPTTSWLEWEPPSRHLDRRGPFALQPLRVQCGPPCWPEQPECAGI